MAHSARECHSALRRTLIIHRHGDRTTITKLAAAQHAAWRARLPSVDAAAALRRRHPLSVVWPRGAATDSWLNRHSGGENSVSGQLTALGVSQLAGLGRSLARADGGLLASPRAISVHSTGRLRTVQSTSSLLDGLLDGVEVGVCVDASLAAAMVPDDPAAMSQRQHDLRDAYFAGDAQRSAEEAAAPLRTALERALDASGVLDVPARETSWEGLFEVVHCYAAHGDLGVALPIETSEAHELASLAGAHVAQRWFGLYSSGLEYSQLSIGRFLRHLGAVLQFGGGGGSGGDPAKGRLGGNAASTMMQPLHHHDNDAAPELHIFSAHDSTLTAVLCALGVEPVGEANKGPFGGFAAIPPYASYLRLDVLQVEGGAGTEVRVRFNDEEVAILGDTLRPSLDEVMDRIAERGSADDVPPPAARGGAAQSFT